MFAAATRASAGRKAHCNAQRGLSPFDPVVWDRKRAEQLFDLATGWSAIPQRRNASMAILFAVITSWAISWANGCQNASPEGILEVISLWLQEGIKPTTTRKKGYVRRLLISLTGSRQRGDIRMLPARPLY